MLQALQQRVQRDIPERFRYPRLLSVLALQEEVGELLFEVSQSDASSSSSGRIASEIGDVLLSCIEIANAYRLALRISADPPVSAYGGCIALGLCFAAARVSKECLEIEGFGQGRHEQLHAALNCVVVELYALADSVGVHVITAFEEKFAKILRLIADGTWDRLYGDILEIKREKLD